MKKRVIGISIILLASICFSLIIGERVYFNKNIDETKILMSNNCYKKAIEVAVENGANGKAQTNRIISIEEGRRRIFEEDNIYLQKLLKLEKGATLGYDKIYEKGSLNLKTTEGFYRFYVASNYSELGTYLVDRVTGEVYRSGNQGGMPIYLIKGDKIIKTYPWS